MMETTKQISISLGALEPPLTKQLDGLISKSEANHFQKDNAAINRLLVRGFLMDRETERVRLRLMAKIQQAIKLGT